MDKHFFLSNLAQFCKQFYLCKIKTVSQMVMLIKWNQHGPTCGATTLSIMTLSIMTLSIMTLSIMTLSIMTLSIKGVFTTLSINDPAQKHSTIMLSFIMLYFIYWHAECYYADCCGAPSSHINNIQTYYITPYVVWCLIKWEQKSQHSLARIWTHPRLFISPLDWRSVCSVYPIYFEIFRCLLYNGHFVTDAISYSLLSSVSHSVNMFLSFSLSQSSVYSTFCFYLSPFHIKRYLIHVPGIFE
jgi:hypothetical protein